MRETHTNLHFVSLHLHVYHSAEQVNFSFTFKCLGGSRCVILIWVKLQGQLSVRLFKILLRGSLFNSKNLVIIFTALNSAF